MKTVIIAEAGVNHNGDMTEAKKLIDSAARCGVDFIKFQSFKSERLVTRSAAKADYQLANSCVSESQYEMLSKLELSEEDHILLMDHCKTRKIKFISTAFDIESVNFLHAKGLTVFKIPSGEITNLPYLRHIGSLKKEVILSTGMSNLGEVETALNILESSGTSREMITLLHCTTDYPTSMKDVNLTAMLSMRKAFATRVGYSDHTLGIEVAIAAVTLGAVVIEKHFTLNKNALGPDHKASIEPDELKCLVDSIRNIECALGDGIKRPTSSETTNISVVRKSIVASQAIKKGQIISETNICVKRPGTGISPLMWDEVIGKVANRDFDEDELIEL